MKYDELAFVNQQLAGMLKSGLPLEGALKQLCATMRHGTLRTELEKLEADLAQGTPAEQALGARRLPEFYVAMLRVGIASNNLPGVLLLLGDYYQQVNSVWTRLKGLMVYPVIVFVTSLILSIALASLFTALYYGEPGVMSDLFNAGGSSSVSELMFPLAQWVPVSLIALITVGLLVALLVPPCRRWLRWRIPAFREASLSQFAAAFALLLSQGCQPREALELLRHLEAKQPLEPELARWQERLAAGQARFPDLAAGGKVVPPLFVWLVASAGEDWVGGLRNAAEIYYRRAMHHIEMALYAALPVSILALGLLIVAQMLPFVMGFVQTLNMLLMPMF